MKTRIGVIMNGVTGRIGTNQHLIRSIAAIRQQGGIPCGDGDVIWPDPILLGRSEAKLRPLAEEYGISRWSTELQSCLANPEYTVYFDALSTQLVRTVISRIKARRTAPLYRP